MVMNLQMFMIKKLDPGHICLAVISLDSALKKDETYYPQFLLKECKYIEKEVVAPIIDNLKKSSDDCNDSDEE